MSEVRFQPRRLGHVNLYISQLERSIAYYEKVCGIELVRIEAAIRAGFHSNGNTHHDIGLIEISKGEARLGRDGKVQIASARGAQVGLNHLGWEMESEAQLVEAYQRLRTAGISAQRPSDHLISHSIYIADPDGNYHEFYADVIEDWRQIFNLDHDDLVTSAWDPLAKPPSTEKYYPVDPPLRRVKAAPLQPTRITGATLATRHYPVMRDFLTEVAGLKVLEEIASGSRRTVFTGTTNQPDLTLMEVGQGDPLGLRMFSFQLQADCDLAECAANLAQADGPKPRLVNDPTRQAIVLSDPDGFQIEFYKSGSREMHRAVAA